MLTLAAADTIAGVAQSATTVNCTIFGMQLNAGVEAYSALYQGQLAAAAATIYTVPGSTQAFIRSIHVVNTNASTPQTFQLFRGGTAAANAITPIFVLPAGGSATYEDGDGWMLLNANGQLLTTAAVPTTRAIFLEADQFNLNGCIAKTLGAIGAGPIANKARGAFFADAITSGCITTFVMPDDAQTALISIRPMWVPDTSDATPHTVRWQMIVLDITTADVTSAGTTITWTGGSAARTANVAVVDVYQATTGVVTIGAGDLVRIEIQRLGADGADTYVGGVVLLGLHIDYQAVS
jgi:hypothetical protein